MQQSRILVVDDEETVLFAMHDYFGTLGYLVDCATDLATAYALLDQTQYLWVIADLRLGGSGNQQGLELVKFVHERHPGTRSVLLTAQELPALSAEARRLGAEAVMNKPTSLPMLAQLVRS